MDDIKKEDNKEVGFDFTAEKEVTKEQKEKKVKIPFAKIIAVGLVLAIVLGFSIGAGVGFVNNQFFAKEYAAVETAQPAIQKTEIVLSSEEIGTVEIVEKLSPSVVGITSKVKYRDWFNNIRESNGSGSGVIFKKDEEKIYILTNSHVIDGATELMVEMDTDDFQTAEVIGNDKMTDLAVIAVENSSKYDAIEPVEFADSDLLQPGQKVIALGNPLGYNNTVTTGVISALDRNLEGDNPFKLIQTDAAINPGNSGGALLDSQGRLIGINTIKISETSVEGIGFAIPVNSILPIIDEIVERGFVSRPYLGIYGREVTEDISELYEIPMGIFVSQIVEGSGAIDSDLMEKDIIIAIDDVKVFTMKDLTDALTKYEVGDTVTLKVVRDGETKKQIKVKLTQRED